MHPSAAAWCCQKNLMGQTKPLLLEDEADVCNRQKKNSSLTLNIFQWELNRQIWQICLHKNRKTCMSFHIWAWVVLKMKRHTLFIWRTWAGMEGLGGGYLKRAMCLQSHQFINNPDWEVIHQGPWECNYTFISVTDTLSHCALSQWWR